MDGDVIVLVAGVLNAAHPETRNSVDTMAACRLCTFILIGMEYQLM